MALPNTIDFEAGNDDEAYDTGGEALMTINVLIPKLRAAKMAQPQLNTRQQRMCLHCED